jgi:hypothetical protein
MMILSLAHAPVEDASRDNLFGAWSDLVVGDRPNGLIDCYLLEDEGVVQVAAIWESAEAHDRAIGEERTHPAFVVFEASGLDPTHSVFNIVGRLGN